MVQEMQQNIGSSRFDNSTDESEDSIKEYDLLPDADKDKNIFRTKVRNSVYHNHLEWPKLSVLAILSSVGLIMLHRFYIVIKNIFTGMSGHNGNKDSVNLHFFCVWHLGHSVSSVFGGCLTVHLWIKLKYLLLVAFLFLFSIYFHEYFKNNACKDKQVHCISGELIKFFDLLPDADKHKNIGKTNITRFCLDLLTVNVI